MDLLIPGSGLFIWQLVGFLVLFFLLSKFAWRPILDALKVREMSIQEALESAESAKAEMAKLQADNKKLLEEARIERDAILKEALTAANAIREEAKEEATKIGNKMIADAKAVIATEKNAALNELKNHVATLSIDIAEKVIRKNLSSDKAQKDMVEELVKDIKVN
ncbi:F0F1 ATP synthase subunit B [Cytophagales bacterium LB-30]|uniref:ATP synthase subunit b n=1 Tax=Shiella aurantiaca TaxID=3058365 RepID=A0ABT8F6M7_9BACT|nr:F0F1 ATP synthase subunit B [Shiella aurantiaca]MDN4166138.1 F0F1 ATP synthase subunit B [Shiella aurantiaca]